MFTKPILVTNPSEDQYIKEASAMSRHPKNDLWQYLQGDKPLDAKSSSYYCKYIQCFIYLQLFEKCDFTQDNIYCMTVVLYLLIFSVLFV